jgi:hypothetical protein
MSVSVAVKDGRLKESVVRDQFDQPKICDPELADQEWEANTDPVKRQQAMAHYAPPEAGALPAPTGAMTFGEASAVEKLWKARQAELNFREEAKELIRLSDAEKDRATDYTEIRTRLLGIPSRLRQDAPHIAPADIIRVENLIREALQVLADG